MVKKPTIIKWMLGTLWVCIAAGTVVLLVAAINKKDEKKCTGVNINISGVSDNFFVDKKDIIRLLTARAGANPVGKPVGLFDLRSMEAALQRNIWVKSAQLFFDNNERLQVNVLEREPEARVFTTTGSTFYLDTSIAILPLSEKFSARLPVFTNFPFNGQRLNKSDSALLRSIVTISTSIQKNEFLMAMIDQVDITPQGTFEMIPKFGNTVIVFGDATDATEKFDKLLLFYKEVVVKAGWNKYTEINVRFKNQVVAKRKGADEQKADSLRTLQLMKVIAENAEKLASDTLHTIAQDNERNSTNGNLIQQSIQRDDNGEAAGTNEQPGTQSSRADEAPAEINSKTNPGTKTIQPAIIKKQGDIKPLSPAGKPIQKPKMLMPKALQQKTNNEY